VVTDSWVRLQRRTKTIRALLTKSLPCYRNTNLQSRSSQRVVGDISEVRHACTIGEFQLPNVPSRSGEPRWDTVTSSQGRPSWASSVDWTKADLLKPESYKQYLQGANAVVHSMGILLEADYKGVVQGREPIISGLQRAFSSSKLGSQNPLERKEGEALEPKESDRQLTYELMNRDSGLYMAMPSVSNVQRLLIHIKPLHWHRNHLASKFRRSYTSPQPAEHQSFPADISRPNETPKQPYHRSFQTCGVSLCALRSCMIRAESSLCR